MLLTFFSILFNEMYHHLEDLYNLVDLYFPNDQCMTLENYAWVKILQVLGRPIDFNITEYKKFIDMVSNSTLLLTFKKLPLHCISV